MSDKSTVHPPVTPLRTDDHRRDVIGATYVYPVLSRRAGGISIGINLNTNNACNWRCVYCQVDGLQRGSAPPVDLWQLGRELDDYLRTAVTPGDGTTPGVVDVAIAGNGEPTSATAFPEVISLVAQALRRHRLDDAVRMRIITNGSLIRRGHVEEGLRRLAANGGEVWFKLDAGSPEVRRQVNSVVQSTASVVANLGRAASLCRTWVQTCAFGWGDRVPLRDDLAAYLDVLGQVGPQRLEGVLLYGIARPSRQSEAPMLRRLDDGELEAIAEAIRKLEMTVRVAR